MKLTLTELVNLHYELNGLTITQEGKQAQISKGLLQQKASMKTKLYVQRLNKIVAEEIELLDKSKKELFEKMAEVDTSVEVKEGQEPTKSIPESKWADFNKEYDELMKAEKEINVETLWSTDLTVDSIASIETDENYPIFLKLIDK